MHVRRGLIAGAAGTVTLNVLTYLDMAVRARPASSVPAQTVERAADAAGAQLAADDERRQNRSQGLGALLGYVSGLGFGVLYGVVSRRAGDRIPVPAGALGLTVAAMAGANLPATVAGVTHPGEWGVEGWAADIVPHLAYGFATATVYDRIDRS